MELSRHYESRRSRRWLGVCGAMVLAGVTAFAVYDGVASSPKASAVADAESMATVQRIGDTGLTGVVLKPSAAKRLEIRTAPADAVFVRGTRRTVIPYTAVLYDSTGDTWTYTSPRPLVYVRRNIRIDEIDGGVAVLSKGLRPGTRVVTVGSAELWGIEYGEIKED